MNGRAGLAMGCAAVVALAACGETTTTSVSSPTPSATTATSAPSTTTGPTPAPTAASTGAIGLTCPTSGTVNSALGSSVNGPVTAGAGTSAQLPAAARAIVCEYHGGVSNVIIEIVDNVGMGVLDRFSDKYPVAFTTVPGLGDAARAFRAPITNGFNEGVVALSGTSVIAITATATPASLSQVESLVRQLL